MLLASCVLYCHGSYIKRASTCKYYLPSRHTLRLNIVCLLDSMGVDGEENGKCEGMEVRKNLQEKVLENI